MVNPDFLLTISAINFDITLNSNRKKFETRQNTSSISKLFYSSLILKKLQKSPIPLGFFIKNWSLPSRLKLMKEIKNEINERWWSKIQLKPISKYVYSLFLTSQRWITRVYKKVTLLILQCLRYRLNNPQCKTSETPSLKRS